MTWVLVIGAGWVLLAALTAVVIGRAVSLADARAAAEASDESNVDGSAGPGRISGASVLRFPASSPADASVPAPRPAVRDTPTVPGIPAARPPAPGARNGGSDIDQIRRTGLV